MTKAELLLYVKNSCGIFHKIKIKSIKPKEGIGVPVRIRLMRFGRRNRPFYRVVVADSRAPRDGKYIDKLGYYDPLKEPYEFKIDEEKVKYWLSKGAEPTETVRALLRRAGIKV
jgi:small subunit ribosomal protein S16